MKIAIMDEFRELIEKAHRASPSWRHAHEDEPVAERAIVSCSTVAHANLLMFLSTHADEILFAVEQSMHYRRTLDALMDERRGF